MRVQLFIVLAVLLAVAAASDLHAEFAAFKAAHKKHYASVAEEKHRFGVFRANMARAALLNKKNPEARFGASPFADLTAAEFKVYHNSERAYAALQASNNFPFYPRYSEAQVKAAPTNVDWRALGAVTAVKNQGQCGSCWAFSTTGGIEGQWKLAGNPLVSLSEQELVSCDTVDSGCNGGLMNTAYEWLLSNKKGSIVTEASYPYVSGGGEAPACVPNHGTIGATIKGHYNIYHEESQMQAWIAQNGPLSLAVDASAWQMYMGGVMTTCGGSSLDHGVLIVGYTFEGVSTPYWIFKNSWGGSWGEGGYIYIAYGSNQCLLTHYPVTSVVTGSTPAPTPVPSGAYFVHTIYDNQNCTAGAQKFIWEQKTCVAWDGVSFTATCEGSNLHITAYYKSLTCSGASKDLTEPVNSCQEADADFVYYTNACVSGEKVAPHVTNSAKALSHLVKKLKK